MKPWQLLLLGAAAGVGIYLLYRQLMQRKSTSGFGDYRVPQALPPWTNLGVAPMFYQQAGFQPADAWKQFAQRRAARGLGDYIPGVTYPLSPISSSMMAVSQNAMPYLQTVQTVAAPMYDNVEWRSPSIDAINTEDRMDPF